MMNGIGLPKTVQTVLCWEVNDGPLPGPMTSRDDFPQAARTLAALKHEQGRLTQFLTAALGQTSFRWTQVVRFGNIFHVVVPGDTYSVDVASVTLIFILTNTCLLKWLTMCHPDIPAKSFPAKYTFLTTKGGHSHDHSRMKLQLEARFLHPPC